MPNVRIELLEGGEMRVRSAAVGLRYFPNGMGDLADGVFKPADLLEAAPEGWRITGRRTDVINIGGRKTSPSEIENVLLSHPSVRDAVVFGLGDNARSEAVCACIVAGEGAQESALRSYCAERLATWQVPRAIFLVDAIPVNARGKVSRAELARRFASDGVQEMSSGWKLPP